MTHLSPARIGLVGDVHANLNVTRNAIKALGERGIAEIHFLGDFGFVWSGGPKEDRVLRMIDDVLEKVGAVALVTGGNHENYDRLLAIEPDAEGLRWLSARVALLPRGWRASTPSGTSIASIGGANSIDRGRRKSGVSWWPQEQITESDLAALGTEHADILLAHDSPPTVSLNDRLRRNAAMWSQADLAYANAGQGMFLRAFLATTPRLAVGGHYHLFHDVTERFHGQESFEARVVVLDADGEANSVAILNTTTLEMEVLATALRGTPIARRWIPTGE
ncbi:metallophosphoesterase [Lacisediminihabitans sp. H27-G8]|uniref:metallophosphoesterase family protein n=1 Tax=Lacisediminihabitans sp. H27-G8 TaxID=3111909 RepID=UPI0038FC2FC7